MCSDIRARRSLREGGRGGGGLARDREQRGTGEGKNGASKFFARPARNFFWERCWC